ncbi:MFS transporter [Superficieibacter sp. 1612_C1]|uniref:MFS transporter n=1 Tax=Superficieibacter sp. 1612_C1 TaxID=2780382 RepID=UPI0018846C43|nr:MFS transporter [Superficieibacter sp. 1612_C1]
MKSSLPLAITGFALIAITYGLARFSWGLMLPAVNHDIPLSASQAGMIAASSFAAYCIAVLGASSLSARYGSRLSAIITALCAAAGLLLMAMATSPALLGFGLFIAGLSPGLASPSLADAVSLRVAEHRQPQVNTLINAGTGAGIILSVPILFFMPGGWRAACVVFALISLACLLLVVRYLPAEKRPKDRNGARLLSPAIRRLAIIAFISGFASAAWWSFGPQILQQQLHVESTMTSMLWLLSGGAGILGIFTGPLIRRHGINAVYRVALLFMVIPLLILTFSHGFNNGLYAAVALAGVGYITLSAVLLVSGAAAIPNAPATGVGIAFFTLAAGQAVGALIFGRLYVDTGASVSLSLFAVIGALMLFFTPPAQSDPCFCLKPPSP